MAINSQDIINAIPKSAKTVYVAYSGGVDSHVLLHILAHSTYRSQIVAVYINHGLQSAADAWGHHCASVCEQLELSFLSISVNVARIAGESLEEAARNARYEAFKPLLAQGDVLLTAQHADDQAETFLLQVLRGAGIAGLASMPLQANFGAGLLLRPLLYFSRHDVLDYATTHQLAWVEDSSNQQDHFDRNYLRLHIMPLLRKRWPAVDKTISRSAEHCAEAMDYLDAFAALHLPNLLDSENRFNCLILGEYAPKQQLLLIRHWLRSNGLKSPSQAVSEAILNQLIYARADAEPCISIQGYAIRRYRNKLYCLDSSALKLPITTTQLWQTSHPELMLDNGHCLFAEPSSVGINAELWLTREVTLKARQGGERLRLPNRQGRHELKKLYQEAGIPPWERDLRPIIYLDGEIAAVAGLWVDAAFWAEEVDCIQVKCCQQQN